MTRSAAFFSLADDTGPEPKQLPPAPQASFGRHSRSAPQRAPAPQAPARKGKQQRLPAPQVSRSE